MTNQSGLYDAARRPFVILDRDGTIIVECNYLSDPNQVELIPGVAKSLRDLARMGCGLVVVTNQSGVGRGYFESDQLELIHERLNQLLDAEGVHLQAIYVCTHTPEDHCPCRKPNTGLLELAALELNFDPKTCFVVGDKVSDIEMGRRVGATTILVRTGYGSQSTAQGSAVPNHVVEGLWEASEVIQNTLTTRVKRVAGGNRS